MPQAHQASQTAGFRRVTAAVLRAILADSTGLRMLSISACGAPKMLGANALFVARTALVARSNPDSQADPTYSLSLGPPAPANRPASSVAGVAARDMPGVVTVKVNGSEGTGSGFVIEGGYIVTNNHVVTLDGLASNASLRVYFSNGK